MRYALLHPFGLTVLLASLVLATLMHFLLDGRSGQAQWVIFLGFLAYAASTVVVRNWKPLIDQRDTNRELSSESEDAIIKADNELEDTDQEEDTEEGTQDNWRLFQRALQRLNNPGFLAQCELVSLLPETLAFHDSQVEGDVRPIEPTPLKSARALRKVLTAAIEQLRPSDELSGSGSASALQYNILQERYIQRRPVAYILSRYSISESHFHVQRRAAIKAVASDLQSREGLFSIDGGRTGEAG